MDYKNILFLILGLILGVRLTDIWDFVKLQRNLSNRDSDAIKNRIQRSDNNNKNYYSNYNNNNNNTSNIAEYLKNDTRVLCWVMTTPQNHLKRAIHVRNTWGSRCTKLLFMSTEADPFLETIKLPVPDGREYLWSKTREAFKYLYDNHLDDADWFLKADDDTYFIMENLRAFLYTFDAAAPVYFGCKFYPLVEKGYMSGGAGYVLSREALRRFGHIGYPNESLCSHNTLSEDKEMGICLHNVGVIAGDSRDAEQRERFLPLAPIHLIPIDISEWYAKYLFYRPPKDLKCCSPDVISFHYIKPKEFYILDYFLYELRAFGMERPQLDVLPAKVNMTALMLKWRDERKRIG